MFRWILSGLAAIVVVAGATYGAACLVATRAHAVHSVTDTFEQVNVIEIDGVNLWIATEESRASSVSSDWVPVVTRDAWTGPYTLVLRASDPTRSASHVRVNRATLVTVDGDEHELAFESRLESSGPSFREGWLPLIETGADWVAEAIHGGSSLAIEGACRVRLDISVKQAHTPLSTRRDAEILLTPKQVEAWSWQRKE